MKELIKKHEEFDKRMNTNDDKINQMMQFADRLNDENHYASDKITEKARSIDERQGKNFSVVLFYKYFFLRALYTSGLALLSGSILPRVHITSEISARFPRWGNVKDSGDEFRREIRETKQTWQNTKL